MQITNLRRVSDVLFMLCVTNKVNLSFILSSFESRAKSICMDQAGRLGVIQPTLIE